MSFQEIKGLISWNFTKYDSNEKLSIIKINTKIERIKCHDNSHYGYVCKLLIVISYKYL
jgi:hypothetical protein